MLSPSSAAAHPAHADSHADDIPGGKTAHRLRALINTGRADVKLLDDGWTAVTRDRSLSAQFEHSIGITETGCEIFTKSPAGLHAPPYA